jgi:hypothetical protein
MLTLLAGQGEVLNEIAQNDADGNILGELYFPTSSTSVIHSA